MNNYAGNPRIAVREIVVRSEVHRKAHERCEQLKEAVHKTREGSPEREKALKKLQEGERKYQHMLEVAGQVYDFFSTLPRDSDFITPLPHRGERLTKAEQCFLAGDFEGMDRALPEEEIAAEVGPLKLKTKDPDEWWQVSVALDDRSRELVLKGILHAGHTERPKWYEDMWRAFNRALDAQANAYARYWNGWYCLVCNQLDTARELFNSAAEEGWKEDVSEDNMEVFEARCRLKLASVSEREGNIPAAIGSLQDALKIFTGQMKKYPDAHATTVGDILERLGNYHAREQAYSVALVEYEESIRITRGLAARDSEAYQPVLGKRLAFIGALHFTKKEYKEAIECYEETIKIARAFLEFDRETFLGMMANAVNNMSAVYFAMNKREKLVPLLDELVALRRELAVTDPDSQLPELAWALCQVALQRGAWKEMKEAYRDMTGGIAVYRALAAKRPSEYLPPLGEMLLTLYGWCWEDERYDESIALCGERVEVYRKLAAENPKEYKVKLVQAIDNLAGMYDIRKEYEVSLKIYIEGVELCRELVEMDKQYGHILGILLIDLGNYYTNVFPDKEKAVAAANESCQILQPLRKHDPGFEKAYGKAKEIIKKWK
ncbi:MAG: tetratricopeptide repeat protein [Odoribacteraceae bacterium]|jgi:tetratricopeptide (TPR) repeat protein|nr:tetratricopeptide repeat protein [Odoribacteraceae bacterium]